MREDGMFMHKNKICVPNSEELRKLVLKEMHNVPYVEHLGYQKKITTVRSQLFCMGMKKDVVDYIARCMECQRVKVENRHPTGFLQPLSIPENKWEVITIAFITKFPRKTRKHDSIMVVVDKITKVPHFILVKMTHKATNIAKIYIKEISRLHGVPKEIVFDRDTKFTSNLWKGLFK
jgi:hypothetical protein